MALYENLAQIGRIPHACALCCTDAGMAEEAAFALCARICGVEEAQLAAYPDFFDLACPAPVKALRELLEECAKRTFCEGDRAVRFTKVHLLSEQAQNLLLKTLEEPPPRTTFLLCGNVAALLPTVRSRCAMLRLGSPAPEEIAAALRAAGAKGSDALLYATAADSLAQAKRLCFEEEYRALRTAAADAFAQVLQGAPPYAFCKQNGERAAAAEVLSFWLGFARDLLASRYGLPLRSPDLAAKWAASAKRFTSGRINCMIEMLTNAASRLTTNASGGATLDMLVTQILEVAHTT